MMHVRELSRAIGCTVLVSFAMSGPWSIGVYCKVENVRNVFGRIDLLVSPVSGSGQGWVSLERVERTPTGLCVFET